MKSKFRLALSFILLSTAAAAAAGSLPPPKNAFQVIPMVSDQAGVAPNTDPNLVNPWGISQAPGNPLWVSDNGTNVSTLYDPSTGSINPLVVKVAGAPTGTVFVPPGTGWPVHQKGKTDDSIFLFDTEGGTILGWGPNANATKALVGVDNSAEGAAYKGLAVDLTDSLLFAADFTKNAVEVYDSNWNLVRTFTDSSLPKRFAPFNVAWINGQLYVAFAKRERGGGIDEVDKKGLGYVDVFDAQGNLQKQLIATGGLDAPWGMVIAPTGFGKFAGALLVGNFGNGRIHAYDATSGDFMGTLKGSDGNPIAIDGLWALFPGSDDSTVIFSAGPDDESHGLLGKITK